jgi:hypothetical protein
VTIVWSEVAICRPSAGGNTQAARTGVSRTRRLTFFHLFTKIQFFLL